MIRIQSVKQASEQEALDHFLGGGMVLLWNPREPVASDVDGSLIVAPSPDDPATADEWDAQVYCAAAQNRDFLTSDPAYYLINHGRSPRRR